VQRTGNRPDEGGDDLDLIHNRWKTQATGTIDAEGCFTVRGFLGDYELTVAKAGRVTRRTFHLPKAGHSLRLVLHRTPKDHHRVRTAESITVGFSMWSSRSA
jgi:hypothetical protein